jgi:hypothetical protein
MTRSNRSFLDEQIGKENGNKAMGLILRIVAATVSQVSWATARVPQCVSHITATSSFSRCCPQVLLMTRA